VANHGFVHNGEVHWEMNFIRLVHDLKVDVVSSLFNVIYAVRLVQGVEDKLCWILSKGRSFEVKTFLKLSFPMLIYLSFGGTFGGVRLI
jgi:hypothetical protein